MQKNNDKFLNKLVKKNYNNELEEVLEKKAFKENTKNLLLSILYKIIAAYKDYEKVKVNVETKEEFVQNIINIIRNDCEDIKIVKLHSEESEMLGKKTFLVEKEKKRIICYPIERKLMYCIAKINKNEKIIKDDYFLIDKTLSDLINVGNNINTVEPMRDFNGYSWTTLIREIESVVHNLIYQNLRILVGNKFLNNWVKNQEFIIDYFDTLKNKLDEKYGEENQKQIIEIVCKISVLLSIKLDVKLKSYIASEKSKIDKELNEINDHSKFIEIITKKKIEVTREIKKVDETLNNKDLLQMEYQKRNEKLPLEDKIFSIRILSNIMIEERNEKLIILENLNELLNPQKFMKYKNELNKKMKFLKLIDIQEVDNEISCEMIKLQKVFLECYKIKIDKVENKQDIINLIYQYRYYNFIPFDNSYSIKDIEELKEDGILVKKKLIKKAHELKVIETFSKNEDIEYQILKNIFNVRIISLDDLNIRIIKEKDKYYVQVFDENVFEERNELEDIEKLVKGDLEIKINKKVKFII